MRHMKNIQKDWKISKTLGIAGRWWPPFLAPVSIILAHLSQMLLVATGNQSQVKLWAPERREGRLCPGLGQHPDTGTGKPRWTTTATVPSASGGKAWPCADCLPLRRSRRIWNNGRVLLGLGAWERWKRPERMEASSRCPGQETDSLPASAFGPTEETDICPTAGVIPNKLAKKNNLTSGPAPR